MSSIPTKPRATPSCRSTGPATGRRPRWTPGSTSGPGSGVTCYRPLTGEESFHVHLPDGKGLDQRQRQGPGRMIRVTDASVYFDHPVHAQAEHTLNIDFLDPSAGPSARVAVELTAESARALAKAIQSTLDSAPPGLIT